MGSSPSKIKEVLKPSSNKVQNVDCVVGGTGGTFRLRDTSIAARRPEWKHKSVHELDREEFIGTQYCMKGVGVYFEIDPDMFFCAHMDCSVKGRNSDVPSENDAATIEQSVFNKLEQYRRWQQFRIDDVNPNSLVIVSTLEEWGGKAVAHGVRRFLRMETTPDKLLNNRAHGFVIEPRGRRPALMPIDHFLEDEDMKKACKPLAGYKMSETKMPKGEWRYSCLGGWADQVVPLHRAAGKKGVADFGEGPFYSDRSCMQTAVDGNWRLLIHSGS